MFLGVNAKPGKIRLFSQKLKKKHLSSGICVLAPQTRVLQLKKFSRVALDNACSHVILHQ